MSVTEMFNSSHAEIGAQVRRAAESFALQASELTGSLATVVQEHANGALSIHQPGDTVTLTASQQAALLDRIGAGVRKAAS